MNFKKFFHRMSFKKQNFTTRLMTMFNNHEIYILHFDNLNLKELSKFKILHLKFNNDVKNKILRIEFNN